MQFIDILKSLTGERRAITNNIYENGVLFYSTQLFHPGKEPLLFFQAENGIEFFAPEMNLYLFFPWDETALIPSYLDYLKNNFITLTKAYSLKKGTPEKLLQVNDISKDDRDSLLGKLNSNLANEKLIQEYMKRIKYLARTHHFEVEVKNEQKDYLKIRLDSNNTKLQDKSFCFQKTVAMENLLMDTENQFSKLDKSFADIEQAIKFYNQV